MNHPVNKILLVDDHQLLREALSNLINSFDNFTVIGAVGNGREMQNFLAGPQKPDIILLDLNMPLMDGFESAKWMSTQFPDIKVMILTMYDSETALIRLLRAGVNGFLKKDVHPNELKSALNSIAENRYYYSHDTTGKLAGFFHRNTDHQSLMDKVLLTDKELEFLKLASTEMTYKEIAGEMKISPRAIDNFRDTLFEKLDVKSRVGLAIYAVKNGIVAI